MLRRLSLPLAVFAVMALVPAHANAQYYYRPDLPFIGVVGVGDPGGATNYAAVLELSQPPYWTIQSGGKCFSPTDPTRAFEIFAQVPESVSHSTKGAKGKQKQEITVTFYTADAVYSSIVSDNCSIKWQVKDVDGDFDYDGGTDTMSGAFKCKPAVVAEFAGLGLDEAGQAAFLAAFDNKLACKVSGVPANQPPPVCFRGDTPVATESGLRAIRDLKVGDLVWSRDEATGKDVLSPIERIFENPGFALREVVAGIETLHTTDAHPFRVEGKGWVKAKDLALGDRLVARDGAPISVASNRIVDGTRFYAGYDRPAASPGSARLSDLRWTATSYAPQSRMPQDTPEAPTVFNIEVGTHHNYYVGASRILVHNK